jgi:hypothetical protein
MGVACQCMRVNNVNPAYFVCFRGFFSSVSESDDPRLRFRCGFLDFGSSGVGEVIGGEVDGPRVDSIEIEESLPDEELLDEDSERCRRAMMIVVGKGISNAIYAICDITSFIWSC